ncbi:MAG: hypothetical protein HWE13_05890 [Gammaproteobacteria bacterium]|nr:hypothetical protein [Gammaproteobacteria bacterium]
MPLHHQLNLALWQSIYRLHHMRRSSFIWLAVYLAVGCVVFIICGSALLHHQEGIKQALLNYLFPESWQAISEQLLRFFFESQAQQVLANLIISGSLVVASLFLFPIKERLSYAFEQDLKLPLGSARELPLWQQGLEEARLLFFYVTAQMAILWIGYYPYTWATQLSVILSYLFLFYTFALDIIAPTLQRHQYSYGRINKLLGKNLAASLSFGALFSLPALLIGQWLLAQEDYNLLEVSVTLFIINLFFIAISIPVATYIAVQLARYSKPLAPVSSIVTWLSYSVGLILFVTGTMLHARLIQSMHHKSQVLKANYSLDWDSFEFRFGSLSDALSGKNFGKIEFDLVIENPTEYDLVFERSLILIEKNAVTISEITVQGFQVPAQNEHHIKMEIDAISDFSSISDFSTALKDWRIELRIELFPDIPFIIALYGNES